MGVVISSALVLSSQVGDQPNNQNPIVGYRNLATVNNIVAGTADLSFPAINLANPSTYLRWLGANTSEQYVTINHNAVDPIDYVAIAGHNFGSAQIPVSIEGNDGGGFDELVSDSIPADDGPLLFRFVPQSLQSVRIRLQPGNAAPQAAVVYVGRLLILPRRIYVGYRPLPLNRKANIVTGRSELGQFLGRIVLSQMTESQISMSNVLPAFYRSDIEPWLRDAVERPWFFAWRPGDYPSEVGYCWASGDSQVNNALANGMVAFSLNLQGIAS